MPWFRYTEKSVDMAKTGSERELDGDKTVLLIIVVVTQSYVYGEIA